MDIVLFALTRIDFFQCQRLEDNAIEAAICSSYVMSPDPDKADKALDLSILGLNVVIIYSPFPWVILKRRVIFDMHSKNHTGAISFPFSSEKP